uniref:Ig-like domain-containing protein n=1 Tax=Oreochromis niloticus TaxID=8128 RepID=A0A669BPG2_ORENI
FGLHGVVLDVQAKLGDDVSLQCQISRDEIISVLKWSRADLNTDGYIYFYRNKHNQHPAFENRVDLQDRQMKDGDVSLILKNVTINDTGTYECHVFRRGTNHRIRTISLSVLISLWSETDNWELFCESRRTTRKADMSSSALPQQRKDFFIFQRNCSHYTNNTGTSFL